MGTYIDTRSGAGSVAIGRTVIVGAALGMIAGMAMAMVEMLAGWASAGHSAWDAHMMNSAILGIIFLTIATRYLRHATWLQATMAGLAYGAVAYLVILQGPTRLRSGAEQALFTGTAVSSQPVWIIAHLAFGMVLGLGFVVVRDRVATGQ